MAPAPSYTPDHEPLMIFLLITNTFHYPDRRPSPTVGYRLHPAFHTTHPSSLLPHCSRRLVRAPPHDNPRSGSDCLLYATHALLQPICNITTTSTKQTHSSSCMHYLPHFTFSLLK